MESDGAVYSSPLRSGRSLVGAQDAVVRVALSGGEASFAEQLARLVDGRLHDVPGGLVDILLEQGAAEVIGTEEQTHLSGSLALGEPGGLNVIHVVEVEPRGGEDAQVHRSPGV